MTDPSSVLQEFYQDKLAAVLSHQAGARLIRQYDFNNTYQYIINREETQLSWVARALLDLGIAAEDQTAEPDRHTGKRGEDESRRVLEEDARDADAFVERWRGKVDAVADTRHRGMLRIILGETLEQKRFFQQALAGQTDLLGRRTDQVGPRVGEVLPARWIE